MTLLTKSLLFTSSVMMASALQLDAQYATRDTTYKKRFVGSTLFMLANVVADNNPPDLLYLNLGYRMTRRDVISVEFKTWKYGWPIGIPYGKSFEAEGEGFPGYIRERGVSLNYERFLTRGIFTQIDVMPAWQTFVNKGGNRFGIGDSALIARVRYCR